MKDLIVIAPLPHVARRFISDMLIARPHIIKGRKIIFIGPNNTEMLLGITEIQLVNLGFYRTFKDVYVTRINRAIRLGQIEDKTRDYKRIINGYFNKDLYNYN